MLNLQLFFFVSCIILLSIGAIIAFKTLKAMRVNEAIQANINLSLKEKEILDIIDEKWHEDAIVYLKTLKASDEFLEYIASDQQVLIAINLFFGTKNK